MKVLTTQDSGQPMRAPTNGAVTCFYTTGKELKLEDRKATLPHRLNNMCAQLSDKKRKAIQASGLCGIQTWFLQLVKSVLSEVRRLLFRIPSPFVLDQTFRGLRRAF
jgi:hypothetical protein